MTEQETAQIVYVIGATYPSTFQRYDKEMYARLVRAWHLVLQDYEYGEANAGLSIFLSSETKGFPPSPGQIVECIQRIRPTAETGMTATEAWSLVLKAVRNSAYNAEDEFEHLPPMCKRAVGSPGNLREMALMDKNTVGSVEQSHFIRTYNSLVEREKQDAKLPARVRQLIAAQTKPKLPEYMPVPDID